MHLKIKHEDIGCDHQKFYKLRGSFRKHMINQPRQRNVTHKRRVDRQPADINAGRDTGKKIQHHRADAGIYRNIDCCVICLIHIFFPNQRQNGGYRINQDPHETGTVIGGPDFIVHHIAVLRVSQCILKKTGELIDTYDSDADACAKKESPFAPRLALNNKDDRKHEKAGLVHRRHQQDDKDDRDIFFLYNQAEAGKDTCCRQKLPHAVVHPGQVVG